MHPARLSRASFALVLVAVLAAGVVLGTAVTALGDDRSTPTPRPTPTASPSPAELPGADVDGEDLPRLPRYPGSVRTEYEISRDDRYRLTAVEYVVDATVEAVRAFYQGVIDEHGWDRADVNYAAGEWTYVLVDGRTEALIEIEEWSGLIEIDLQVSEPIEEPATPSPEPRSPSPRPSTAAPSPSDDDDDDRDDDDRDDDTDDPDTDG